MAISTTFRCPDDIDAVIRSQMQITGQDKTAVIVGILRAGIQATNDDVELSTRKTGCKTVWESSDLIAAVRAELVPELNQMVLDNLKDARIEYHQLSKQFEQLEKKLPA